MNVIIFCHTNWKYTSQIRNTKNKWNKKNKANYNESKMYQEQIRGKTVRFGPNLKMK